MRTTLTLDEDVAAQLRRELRRSGLSMKAAVNHFLRLGLATARQPPRRRRFVVVPRHLGLPEGLSYDSVSSLLDALEGPLRR